MNITPPASGLSASDIKVDTTGLDSAIADVGAAVDKVIGYGEDLLESIEKGSEKYTDKKSEIDDAFATVADGEDSPCDEKSFNDIINGLIDNDDDTSLDTEITNDLKMIILLQMTTDQDNDGDVDEADVTALYGEGDEITLTPEQEIKFKELLTQTLLAYPDSASLKSYVDGIVDNDTTTDGIVP